MYFLSFSSNSDAVPDKLFNFSLSYNQGPRPLYNGNISQTQWRTANTDKTLKSYQYTYDALNRITNATDNMGGNYGLSGITYDKNGNITGLSRQGRIMDSPILGYDEDNDGQDDHFGAMDILDYAYHNDQMSNRLHKVRDDGEDVYGFKDSSGDTQDYWYDANGNMTRDLNKGIGTADQDGITYNHLNLPVSVTIDKGGNVGAITYVYDALGTKLEKVTSGTSDGNPLNTTTQYAGNYVYENGTLQFFNHPEGYVNANGGGYDYVYQYKDHLGNVRVSYTEDPSNPGTPTIIEENNYYPFGGRHKGYNTGGDNSLGNDLAQQWKFGGKEYDESLDFETYDFGARNYDPWLGRWMNLDPLAEMMRRHSPYNYAFDNPIFFIDPDGMAPRRSSIFWGFGDDAQDTVIIKNDCGNTCDENSQATNEIQDFLNVLNEKLGGFNTVDVTEEGELFISRTDKEGEASEEASNLARILNNAINDKETVTLTIMDNSDVVRGGSYNLGAIDMADVKKFGNGPLESAAGVIAHELVEQFEKQVNNRQYLGINGAHAQGIKAGNLVNGSTRKESGMRENGNVITLPYEKDGETRILKITINPSNSGQILKVEQ